ncbi:hypothetical protein CHELA1G11_13308 [Hyphomicrobiales bacterium]|nr:hypothetical protein CHELA1G2_11006 [Hyphomicrobiales bacterium]CAH1670755.1 hypothetical protein CHELA1G11_13308 [Hyphomicrobiales bacterium]
MAGLVALSGRAGLFSMGLHCPSLSFQTTANGDSSANHVTVMIADDADEEWAEFGQSRGESFRFLIFCRLSVING